MSKRKKIILLLIEIVIFLSFAAVQMIKEPVSIDFTQDDLILNREKDRKERESGSYYQLSYTGDELYVVSPAMNLDKGIYRITIEYETNTKGTAEVVYTDGNYNHSISSEIAFVPDETSTSFQIWHMELDRPLEVRVMLGEGLGEEGYLLVKGIQVQTSYLSARYMILKVFALLVLLNVAVWLYKSGYLHKKETEARNVIVGLGILVLVLCLPLMVDHLSYAHDLDFHLMRIEGLKEGLLSHTFPVKIQPTWNNGHGYAVSVFYGDLFLYFPALLRILGVTVQNAYKIFVIVVNIITVVSSYYCFEKMTKSKYAGLFGSCMYSLSLYRLMDVYVRAAVGEYLAIAFVPVIAAALYDIFTMDIEDKRYRRLWIPFMAGYTALIYSHVLSTEIITLFAFFICLWQIKKVFRKQTFLVLIKAVAGTLALTAAFVVPFLDYMRDDFLFKYPLKYPLSKLERSGLNAAMLFINKLYVSLEDVPFGIGMAFVIILLMYILNRNFVRKQEEKLCFGFCILILFMSTNVFPYAEIGKLLPFLKEPMMSLQFPFRFMTVGVFFLSWLSCIVVIRLSDKKEVRFWIMAFLCVINILQLCTLTGELIRDKRDLYQYDLANLDDFGMGNREYLPVKTKETENGTAKTQPNLVHFVHALSTSDPSLEIVEWSQYYNSVTVTANERTGQPQEIEVPLLMYRGYQAVDQNGNAMQMRAGASGRICVAIPAGFSGTFTVSFKEPWYWRTAEALSLCSLLGLGGYMIWELWQEKRKVKGM